MARKRYTLELTERLDNTLGSIAHNNQTTKPESLRFAIELLDAANDAKKDGFKIGAWATDTSGKMVRQREFLGI